MKIAEGLGFSSSHSAKAGGADSDHIERLVLSIEKHVGNRVYYKSMSLQKHVHNLRVQEQYRKF